MDVVENWTGRHANALLRATRSTNETFAARLGVAVRTVAKWNANPDMSLSPEMQQAFDTFLLHGVSEDARARFFLSTNRGTPLADIKPRSLVSLNEISELTSWISESNTSRDAIDRIARSTESLAQAHPRAPAKKILPEVLRLQRETQSILKGGKQRLRETQDLHRLNSDLLAHACMLLGDINEDALAEQYGYAALLFAQEAGSTEAYAWSVRAKTARWQDKHVESADLARQGFDRNPQGPMRAQLAWYEANAAALYGDLERARQAAFRAEEAAETCLETSPSRSVWSFPVERQALFAQSVAHRTGDADAALRAAAMADTAWESGEPRGMATWAQIRVGAGIAKLMKGSLEGTIEEVTPMLGLSPEFRMSTVTRYLDILHNRLGDRQFQGDSAAARLRNEIQEFNSEALKSEGDSTEAK